MIAKYDPDSNTWAKLGDLNYGRRGFGLIQHGGEYLVVGGYKENYKTESCKHRNGQMICSERQPTMNNFG